MEMDNNMLGKRILLISAVFPPEPVVSACISFDLAEALAKRNKVTVVSPTPSRPYGYEFSTIKRYSDKLFNHIVLKSFICPQSKLLGRFRESNSFGRACYSFINAHQNEFDVIYMNTWPLAAQYWTVKAANKNKIPAIVHIQDIYPESLTNKLPVLKKFFLRLLLPIDKYVTNRCAKVVTISMSMGQQLANTRQFPLNKLEVIYNWQDEKKYGLPAEVKKTNNSFVFMYLGSLSPSAAIDRSIEAFIHANIKNSELIIAGGGSEKGKLQLMALNHKDTNIKFIDAPAEKTVQLQAQSDILLLTLKKGVAKLALPSKLPAYMFSSKPILASIERDSDSARAILDAGCGWVVEPESVEKMSESMKRVAKADKDELNRMGERGYHYAMNHFSKHQNLQNLTEIIEKTAK